jgi:general secretion pathway protein D
MNQIATFKGFLRVRLNTIAFSGRTDIDLNLFFTYTYTMINFNQICKLLFSSCLTALLLVFSCTSILAADPPAGTKQTEKVTFNFVDVDLASVTKFISEITGKNFIFDERLKGKITIIAPSKLSADDAFSLFTSVLELKGFTVVPSGVDAYKIIPRSEAKQSGMTITTEGVPLNESYIVRTLTFNHISADEALKFLLPLVSKDGHISTFGPGNLLLVVDSGLNIEKIISISELIDKPSVAEAPEVVTLQYASADAVAKILNEGFGKGRAGRVVPGQPGADGATAVADVRLNAVIIFGDKAARESMKALIPLLDVPPPEAQGRINVFFLENADATELAKVMEGMLRGPQAARPGVPGTPPGQQVNPFESSGSITITPDSATNSLIIVASPSDYQNIAQILKQLDRRRKQVFVEAMIVEASIDKLRELGTKWRVIARKDGEPVFITGVGKMDTSTLQDIISGLSGLTMGGMGNFFNIPITTVSSDGTPTSSTLNVPGFSALFSLNEFRDAVNILSTPQILTSDNQEAEIVVGENVPFIAARERDITTTSTVINSIERQDVGIKLRITPHITEGDYIRLDLYQEISSVKEESENIVINVGPTTTMRSTKTAVVVKDRHTVVIGGLMEETDEENIVKIPILGDIPILGYLFKEKRVSKRKTNLLVFLTPHVVKESQTLARITGEKHREVAMSNKQYAEGSLLVKFREGVSEERICSLVDEEGASLIEHLEKRDIYLIKLKKGRTVEEAMERFLSFPEVRYAEPDYTIKLPFPDIEGEDAETVR